MREFCGTNPTKGNQGAKPETNKERTEKRSTREARKAGSFSLLFHTKRGKRETTAKVKQNYSKTTAKKRGIFPNFSDKKAGGVETMPPETARDKLGRAYRDDNKTNEQIIAQDRKGLETALNAFRGNRYANGYKGQPLQGICTHKCVSCTETLTPNSTQNGTTQKVRE